MNASELAESVAVERLLAVVTAIEQRLAAPAGLASELLSPRDAAKLVGIGERTLWRYSDSGQAPPPIKLGQGKRAPVYYRRRDLLDWIAGGCRPIDANGANGRTSGHNST